MLIKPLVGHPVWYYPPGDVYIPRIEGQPLAGIIVGVFSDTSVNLAYFDANGYAGRAQRVQLVHGGSAVNAVAGWCEFTPRHRAEVGTQVVEADATKARADQMEADQIAAKHAEVHGAPPVVEPSPPLDQREFDRQDEHDRVEGDNQGG